MSYLDKFSEDQRGLLVSLPYRTGMWVGESDDEGGAESAEAEMQALEALIIGYSEDFLKSEFVEEVMKQTLKRREQWDQWGGELKTVPKQCRQVVDVLNSQLGSKESLSYRQALMEIAMAVAMAYREFDDQEQPLQEKIRVYGSYYWQCFMARLKKEQPPNLDEILNISRSERAVLVELSQALRVDMEGHPLDKAEAV